MNPYYNGGAFPATGAPATSASMRAELSSISTGFDKLPTLSGNANKLVTVNSSGTALEAVSVLPSVTITDTSLVVEDNADSTRKFRFEASGITAGATRVLTIPDASTTLVGTDTVQTLTNKTFNLTNNLFTATSAQLAAAVTDETGTGALVFGTNPTISGATLTGGSLNNAPVGATTASSGAFTTLSASSTVSGTGFSTYLASPPAIGSTAANTGAFTTLSASSNVTLSGGTANGVAYLNASKVLTSGTALAFDGTNLVFGSSGQRITGDMSNATQGNNLAFQTSTTNGNTTLRILPNGTGSAVALTLATDSTQANGSTLSLFCGTGLGESRITSGINGSGTYLPITFYVNAAEQMRLSSTTLTLTNNPTLSGGTANGVTYLNGSKVLTSGSALTFDGTGQFVVNRPSGSAGLILQSNDASTSYLFFGDQTSASVGRIEYDHGTNGMPFYVNGSEQMRLTSTGLGIGTSSPAAKLGVVGNAIFSGSVVSLSFAPNQGGSTPAYLQYTNSTSQLDVLSSGAIDFQTGGSTASKMRLDASGNLGIGTSSPGSKLHLSVASGSVFEQITSGSNQVYLGWDSVSSMGTFQSSTGLTFATGGSYTERMRLDSSGNLGLGVTPSGWSGARAFQMPNGVFMSANSGTTTPYMNLGANTYFDGTNWIYSGSFAATRYDQLSGAHRWFNAASGTAGNAISFTQAMTLNAAGNLLLGSTTAPTGFSRISLVGGEASGTGANTGIQLTYNASTFGGGAITTVNAAGGGLSFYTFTGNVGSEAYTERARITSGGNLLVGTTSGSADCRLTVSGATADDVGSITLAGVASGGRNFIDFRGASSNRLGRVGFASAANAGNELYVYNQNADAILFGTNNTERARITSGGDLLVGTTTTNGKFNSLNGTGDASQPAGFFQNNKNFAGIQGIRVSNGNVFNDTGHQAYSFDEASTLRFEVRSNGGIANYSGNDVNLSDRREKTNFAPAKSYLDTICAIPVQTFNYIDQSEDDPGLTLGVVAQDVQAVAPELVMESNWGTEDNPKMRLSIYQTDLQYALMKCIQEQQALITDLRARVAALEA